MAVETRYVVVRTDKNNKEQEVMTFTDKRAADEHDKMLDMADGMFEILHSSTLKLDEEQCEELSIYLAKHREDVLFALQAKKKTPAKKKAPEEKQTDLLDDEGEQISPKSLSETLIVENTESNTKVEDNMVDFVIEKDEAA
mgnify:CR=1 FL=1